jgi:hypothetical protein
VQHDLFGVSPIARTPIATSVPRAMRRSRPHRSCAARPGSTGR